MTRHEADAAVSEVHHKVSNEISGAYLVRRNMCSLEKEGNRTQNIECRLKIKQSIVADLEQSISRVEMEHDA